MVYNAATSVITYRNHLVARCVMHGMVYIQYIDYVDRHVHGDMIDVYILTKLEYMQAQQQLNQLKEVNHVE